MNLDERYALIHERFEKTNEFPPEEQEKSRMLFEIKGSTITPKMFNVWTCLAGLPAPAELTQNLKAINGQLSKILPSHVRFYQVSSKNYHWETFIIKRPDEDVSVENIKETENILADVISKRHPFVINYRGFLVTIEGTIIVKGYGDFDNLRDELLSQLPFASKKQSRLGHISIGRILDPVDPEVYAKLKSLVANSQQTVYGQFLVDKIKYVHETQWYMENKKIISEYSLRNKS